jgi:septum formation protein
MTPDKPRIILASSSSYRRSLLQRLALTFEVASPDVDESAREAESPRDLVLRLAILKAEKLAVNHKDAFIIGSDQVACLDETVLTKPGNAQNAFRQLQMIRGKTVNFITGLALWSPHRMACDSCAVDYKVHFRDYTDDEISRYLQYEEPFDCAGSFKSEQLGISLVRAMQGDDPTALMGLPLIALSEMFREEGH